MARKLMIISAVLVAVLGLCAGITTINLSNQVYGTLPCAQMPALSGDITAAAGACTTAITSGTIARADMAASTVTALGSSGTLTMDMSLGEVYTTTPSGAISLTVSNCASGRRATIIVTTSGTTTYTLTPSTNVKGTALATGTTSGKTFGWSFICNGTTAVQQGAVTAAM